MRIYLYLCAFCKVNNSICKFYFMHQSYFFNYEANKAYKAKSHTLYKDRHIYSVVSLAV